MVINGGKFLPFNSNEAAKSVYCVIFCSGYFRCKPPIVFSACNDNVEGVTTSTSSEFENELDEDKGQFARIRDRKRKFRCASLSKVCDIFAKRVFLVSILKLT